MKLKLHKTTYPALKIPQGTNLISPNQGTTKTYQTLFIYRIKIGSVEKKTTGKPIKLHFWIPGVTKREKTCFQIFFSNF